VVVGDRSPDGWLDLLTWQSRRILLIPLGDPGAPLVCRGAVLKGESVAAGFSLPGKDSMVAWQRLLKPQKDTDSWIPLGFREERAVWRDAHSLLGNFADASIRPPILEWVSELSGDSFNPGGLLALDIAGMCTYQAKVFSWHAESLPLPLKLLRQPELCGQLKLALDLAQAGENTLVAATRRLAERLFVPQESVGGERKSADKEAVKRLAVSLLRTQHYWATLQLAFQSFIIDLAGQSGRIDPDTGEALALSGWKRRCRDAASEAMELACRAAGQGRRTYRAVAEAESLFRRSLNRYIPDQDSQKEVIANVTATA
jgi:CRISPR system Cascade subunit CasA